MKPYHSVVMLNNHPPNDLLLCSRLFSLLQFTLPIGRCARLPPILDHRRLSVVTSEPVIEPYALQDRRVHERVKPQIIVRNAEVEDTEPGAVVLVRGRLHNTVNGRFIIPSRKKFQAVTGIDHLAGNFERLVRNQVEGEGTHTSALLICLIQRHFPSGERIWRAETG